MTRAYICDRCGKILPPDGFAHPIWTKDVIAYMHEEPDLHLCGECFEKFENEYMGNLLNEGGVQCQLNASATASSPASCRRTS